MFQVGFVKIPVQPGLEAMQISRVLLSAHRLLALLLFFPPRSTAHRIVLALKIFMATMVTALSVQAAVGVMGRSLLIACQFQMEILFHVSEFRSNLVKRRAILCTTQNGLSTTRVRLRNGAKLVIRVGSALSARLAFSNKAKAA